jgi:sugar-specific transcriptional regulator TrmB
MKKYIDILKKLGLSDIEATLYIKLLQLGHASISELSRSLSMNRITVHFNVRNLVDRGLITHIKQGRTRELTAQPPENLEYILEQQERSLKSVREELTLSLPLMQQLIPTKTSHDKFDVKFFQGKEGIKAIYREVLKAKEIRSYVNNTGIENVFPENTSLFVDANRLRFVKMWEIMDDSSESREYVKNLDRTNYSYKYFPSEWRPTVFDYMIFDGKIAMVGGKRDFNGIVIVNEEMFQNAKALFEVLWNLLPQPV